MQIVRAEFISSDRFREGYNQMCLTAVCPEGRERPLSGSVITRDHLGVVSNARCLTEGACAALDWGAR